MSKEAEEALREHIRLAERHSQAALDLLYKPGGAKRSFFYRAAVGRVQNILMNLHVKEESGKVRKKEE